jgi:alkaline phosphatase
VPVRATERIEPVEVTSPEKGTYIFNLGQNFAGVAQLKAKGPAGTRIRLRFGEMLHPDGRLMTENLRKARAHDHYVLRGDPEGETYTTSFGATWKGRRTDGENLMDVLLARGYKFVDSKDGMDSLQPGDKAWGLFDDSHMDADIDRHVFHPTQPSIAEMTAKAIELLSDNPNGFFLMVEGSQVDWAGHNNDPKYMLSDFIAFDDAVKVAVEFAEANDETLVLAYPDHNTGGMKIGHYYTAMNYTATTVEDLVEPLMGMKITSGGVAAMLPDMPEMQEKTQGQGNPNGWAKKEYEAAMAQYVQDFIATVEEWWSLTITEDDVYEILDLAPSVGLNYALARMVSEKYTVIGWTTHGHNGETVPVWVYGADAPVGTIDNTELATMVADAFGTSLADWTDELYVDLSTVTDDYEIVDAGSGNLELHVNGATLPISKDYMVKNNGTTELPGLTVYAPATDRVYISKTAIDEVF